MLEQAWSGEPFEYRGMTVQILPTPVQKPRPPIYIGGSTEASALRAARVRRRLHAGHAAACTRSTSTSAGGSASRSRRRRGPKGPLFLFVTDDPERELGGRRPARHVHHELQRRVGQGARRRAPRRTRRYATSTSSRRTRSSPSSRPECVDLIAALSPDAEITFHPLMGGLDPDVGSASLELFATAVLPALELSGRWVRGETAAPLTRSRT